MPTALRLLLAARAVAAADLPRARTLLATAWTPPMAAPTDPAPRTARNPVATGLPTGLPTARSQLTVRACARP